MTERPLDAHDERPSRDDPTSTVLAQAVQRARWIIFWERLWPALASIATAVGVFLILSWLGIWLWLPPIARAVGLFLALALIAAAAWPLLFVRIPGKADALRRLMTAGIQLDGASDHGVSEALYLRDPDDNGVELYRDRPESEWPREADGTLAMFTKRLDLEALLRDRES